MALRLADLELVHDGCWSQITNNTIGGMVYDVNLTMNPSTHSSNASVYIRSQNQGDFREFRNAIRANQSIRKINNITNIYNRRGNSLNFLNFTGVYGRTIATILYEEGSPYYRYSFENGKEHWTFIAYSNSHLSEIMERISDLSSIKRKIISSPDPSNIDHFLNVRLLQMIKSHLTAPQYNVLSLAYRKGFFDSPHGTTTVEMSEMLDLSPSTINQYLKKSEKKIMEILFGK